MLQESDDQIEATWSNIFSVFVSLAWSWFLKVTGIGLLWTTIENLTKGLIIMNLKALRDPIAYMEA